MLRGSSLIIFTFLFGFGLRVQADESALMSACLQAKNDSVSHCDGAKAQAKGNTDAAAAAVSAHCGTEIGYTVPGCAEQFADVGKKGDEACRQAKNICQAGKDECDRKCKPDQFKDPTNKTNATNLKNECDQKTQKNIDELSTGQTGAKTVQKGGQDQAKPSGGQPSSQPPSSPPPAAPPPSSPPPAAPPPSSPPPSSPPPATPSAATPPAATTPATGTAGFSNAVPAACTNTPTGIPPTDIVGCPPKVAATEPVKPWAPTSTSTAGGGGSTPGSSSSSSGGGGGGSGIGNSAGVGTTSASGKAYGDNGIHKDGMNMGTDGGGGGGGSSGLNFSASDFTMPGGVPHRAVASASKAQAGASSEVAPVKGLSVFKVTSEVLLGRCKSGRLLHCGPGPN